MAGVGDQRVTAQTFSSAIFRHRNLYFEFATPLGFTPQQDALLEWQGRSDLVKGKPERLGPERGDRTRRDPRRRRDTGNLQRLPKDPRS